MADYVVKQNDTGPYIEATLEDAGGPVNLTGVEKVLMHMVLVGGGTKITGINMTLVEPKTSGKVKHQWAAAVGETPAELSVPGDYNVEFEVYSGGRRTTFPEEGYKSLTVEPELA